MKTDKFRIFMVFLFLVNAALSFYDAGFAYARFMSTRTSLSATIGYDFYLFLATGILWSLFALIYSFKEDKTEQPKEPSNEP
jgi:hypothetical protein